MGTGNAITDDSSGSGTSTLTANFGNRGGIVYLGGTIRDGSQGWKVGLEVAGKIELVLEADNTYTGGTTIDSGTELDVGRGTTGKIAGNVVDNGLLCFWSTEEISLPGVISGAGAVYKYGSAKLVLGGTNTYSGGTQLNGGLVVLDNDSALGNPSGVLSVNSATLDLNGHTIARSGLNGSGGKITDDSAGAGISILSVAAGVYAGQICDGAHGRKLGLEVNGSSGQWFALTGDNTYTGGTTVDSGSELDIGRNTRGNITGNVTDNGSLWFCSTENIDFSGTISGSGSVYQYGNSVLTLDGQNTYTGATRIYWGTVVVSNIVVTNGASNLGNATSQVTLGFFGLHGGVLEYTGNETAPFTRGFSISADSEIDCHAGSSLTIANPSGASTGGISAGYSLTIGGDGNVTMSSVISGKGGLTKTGSGTLTLAGSNSYSGGTTITGGTLSFASGALGSSGLITFDGGVLQWAGGNTQDISGRIASIAGGQAALLDTNGNNVTLASGLSGNGGLTKIAAGTLTLGGTNTYTGVTTIEGGTLQINGASPTMNVLTNAGGANLTGGTLVLDYTAGADPASTVQSLLATAYGHGFSNTADQFHDTSVTSRIGLGWADSPTINGHAYANQIVVMPALYGDATLDGVVDGYDLAKILGNYDESGMSWAQGDFTYNGTVDGYDLAKILGNYCRTGPVSFNISFHNPAPTAIAAPSGIASTATAAPSASNQPVVATVSAADQSASRPATAAIRVEPVVSDTPVVSISAPAVAASKPVLAAAPAATDGVAASNVARQAALHDACFNQSAAAMPAPSVRITTSEDALLGVPSPVSFLPEAMVPTDVVSRLAASNSRLTQGTATVQGTSTVAETVVPDVCFAAFGVSSSASDATATVGDADLGALRDAGDGEPG